MVNDRFWPAAPVCYLAPCGTDSRDVITRAVTVRISTITMSVSAAVQARWIPPRYGDEAARLKIWADRAVLGPENTFQLGRAVMKPMVNNSGAVSPAARAIASRQPLVMPGRAAGRRRPGSR